MERIVKQYGYDVLDINELSEEEMSDLLQAKRVRGEADTHVSNFGVGACLRMNNDVTSGGWNWENDVQNGLHAERNAIGRLHKNDRASGLKRVTVIGGFVDSVSEDPVAPCGDCRQDLMELWGPGTEPMVIMAGIRGKIVRIRLEDLVPFMFDLNKYRPNK